MSGAGPVDDHHRDCQRCQRCQRKLRRCICAYLCSPPIQHNLRLIVVQSTTERDHIKNTGTLLAGSLVNADILEVRLPSHHQEVTSETSSLEYQLRSLQSMQYTLLYPPRNPERNSQKYEIQSGNGSHPIDHTRLDQYPKGQSLQTLVILDLTWRQSTRVLLSVPHLYLAPRLSLSDEILDVLYVHQLKLYEKMRTVNIQRQTRCSTLEAGLAALLHYDYQMGQVSTLTEGLKRYESIWQNYKRWIDRLEVEFHRSN